MNDFLSNKKMAIILSVLGVVFIIIAIVLPLFNGFFITGESLLMPFVSTCPEIPCDSFLQIYTASDHSWFLMSLFFVEFSRYLPKILHLHPQVSIQLITAKVFLGLFILYLFAHTNNFFKYTKDRLFYAPVLLCVFIFVMSMFKKSDFLWMFSNECWFWSYIFVPMFSIILLSYFEKYYVLLQKPTKREWVSIGVLLFLTAVGHEYFRFIILVGLLFMFIFDRIFVKTDFSVKKFFMYYIPLGFLCTFSAFTFTYKSWASQHVFAFTKEDIFSYIALYFQNIVVEKFSVYLFLIILSVLVLLSVNDMKQNKRLYNFVVSFAMAAFIFMLTLVLGKDSFDYETPLYHSGLQFFFLTTFLMLITSVSGYFFAFSDLSLKNKKIIAISLIFLSILTLAEKKTFDFSATEEYANIRKEIMYIFEKAFVLNKNKNVLYVFDKNSLECAEYYLYSTYYNKHKHPDAELIEVCSPEDDLQVCKEKFRERVKQDLGYTFTDEELKKLDFASLQKLR